MSAVGQLRPLAHPQLPVDVVDKETPVAQVAHSVARRRQ